MLDKFNAMIIEDDIIIMPKMTTWLNRLAENVNQITIESRNEALEAINEHVIHFISVDQHISDNKGESRSVNSGVTLTEDLKKMLPLSIIVVYTGRDDSPSEILKITNVTGQNELWFKSGYEWTEKDENGFPRGDSEGWAGAVIKRLENYLDYYFQVGRDFLPIGLAQHARFLHDMKEQLGHDAERKQRYCGFWEDALLLSWLVGAALIRHYQLPTPIDYDGHAYKREESLRIIVKALRQQPIKEGEKPEGAFWYLYQLGTVSEEAKHRFILEGSEPFRTLRNKFVHENGSNVTLAQMEKPLQAIADGAAFFGRYPLLTGLTEPSRTLELKGRYLRGTTWPWPAFSGTLHERFRNEDATHINSSHVYIGIPEDNRWDLIDVSPWLHLEMGDPQSEPTIYACSHREGHQWFRRNLVTGQVEPWKPTTEQRQRLLGE